MNKYIIITFAIIMVGITNNSIAQQMYGRWVVPTNYYNSEYIPYQLTFTEDGIEPLEKTHQAIPSSDPGYCYFSAGGYNDNYDLLYYVLGNHIYSTNTDTVWIDYAQLSLYPEYQIINRPLSNNEYFAFSSYFLYNETSWISYDIISYDDVSDEATPSSNIQIREFDNGTAAFAITKEVNDQRYIFISSTEEDGSVPPDDGLYRWTITNNGLSEKTTINWAPESSLTEDDYSAYNLEHTYYDDVSGEVDVIAWTHMESNISDEIVLIIDGNEQILDLGLGRIGGIEFSNYEDTMLYAATADSGIVKIDYTDFQNNPNIIVVPNAPSDDYARTFLQTAPDGHIYAVSNDGTKLGVIYQYDDNNHTAGDFEANVFEFEFGTVATFREFTIDGIYHKFYILPENSSGIKILKAEATPIGVYCPDATDGEVTIYVTGGEPFNPPTQPYNITCTSHPNVTFTWDDGLGAFIATGLGVGIYDYTITDQSNTISNQFTINPYEGYTHDEFETYDATETWSGYNESFAYGFKITSNAHITITNSNITFGPLAKVIIEPGSQLTINGTTFSNQPGCEPWQGIEVWGNSNKSQYVGADGIMYQGKLIVEDSSHIKNAKNAVRTHNPADFTSHGGIVDAQNSTFENNWRSVEIMQYQNFNPGDPDIRLPYVSRFKGCTFETNDGNLFNDNVYTHVSLWDVYGIKFFGCRFYNNTTTAQNTGTGIISLNAGYSLLEYCTNTTQPCNDVVINEFNNLYEGIQASNASDGNNRPYINNASFINNSTGIYLSNVPNAIVINSDFEIAPNFKNIPNCGDSVSGFGIDANGSKGFVFENNSFDKYLNAPTGHTYSGIHLRSCPSPHDIIYKNTYTGLSYGNYAEGINRDNPGNDKTGVEYRCNKNFTNAVDFMVDNIETPSPEAGMIRDIQGEIDLASGNWFSQGSENHKYFINMGTEWVTLKYNTNDPSYMIPLNAKLEGFVKKNSEDAVSNQCPDHHGSSGGSIKMSQQERTDKEGEFADNLTDYNSVLALYESLENGGNTTSELLDIETAVPDDMWTLRAQLLGDSPHLSQEVLMNMSDRTDVFPDNVLFDILSANPDELKEDTLISYLENKENPLPAYMITILEQLAYTNTTYKTILINDMAHYFGKKMQAAKSIIHSILADSIVDQVDYRNWLDNMESIEADKQIIASYLIENDTVNAMSLLNLIPSLYELEGDKLDGFNDYKDLLLMQLAWKSQGKTIFNLDSTDIITLEYYANNTMGDASYSAKNILSFAYGYNYCDCLRSTDSAYYKSGSYIINPVNINTAISITATPNPASTWAAFDYILVNDESVGTILISDISGKEITQFEISGKQGQQVWDTRTIKPGMYIYTLTSLGSSVSGKLVIK